MGFIGCLYGNGCAWKGNKKEISLRSCLLEGMDVLKEEILIMKSSLDDMKDDCSLLYKVFVYISILFLFVEIKFQYHHS